MKTKIIIAGGAGFLGQLLANYFAKEGTETIVLSRKQVYIPNARVVLWDGQSLGNWAKELDGADVLINLAGRSVDCRYTEANKKEIMESRVASTRVLGKAVCIAKHPPQVWLNASSATIYRYSEDVPMDEDGEIGEGFSVDVCKLWEEEFFSRSLPGTRRVALRMAMVLGNEGGVWPVLTKLACFGLGGRMGSGSQYISWIHAADFCRSIEFLLNTNPEGPINICAPTPVTNAVFMQSLRKMLGVPIGIPQPKWTLEMGAVLLRTETELVLKSRRVVPGRLQQEGFGFLYPAVDDALNNLAGLKNATQV